MSASLAQLRVLDWLAAFPNVEIHWNGPDDRPHWTATWASEEARQHMIHVMGTLGDDTAPERSRPRFSRSGGTPRITLQTVRVLARHGWIKKTKHRPRRGVFAEAFYWQISAGGKAALLRALPLDPDAPEET